MPGNGEQRQKAIQLSRRAGKNQPCSAVRREEISPILLGTSQHGERHRPQNTQRASPTSALGFSGAKDSPWRPRGSFGSEAEGDMGGTATFQATKTQQSLYYAKWVVTMHGLFWTQINWVLLQRNVRTLSIKGRWEEGKETC